MRKRLIAFVLIALVAAPVPTALAAADAGQFVVRCPFSHRAMDDPIVFPGQPGASHEHDFFGNETTDAFSTLDTMLAGDTTCRILSDTAGYWTPSPYLRGERFRPPVMRVYYLGEPDAQVETFPPGLKIIGGNKAATSPQENPHVQWYCGEIRDVATPREDAPYDCTRYAKKYSFVDGVVAIIDFPSCWDGDGLAPSHVRYQQGGACPNGFGHHLPHVSERLHLGIMDPLNRHGKVVLSLSSGPFWTMHGDFWNTWQQARLDELVRDCLDAHIHCGGQEPGIALDWTQEFGTSRYDLAYGAAPLRKGVVVAGFTNYRLPDERFHHLSDVFVRSVGTDGGSAWTTQFGGSGRDQALAVTTTRHGVFVAGTTDGRLPKQRSAGGADAFVAMLGTGGRVRWIRQFGTQRDDRASAITVVPSGLLVGGDTDGRFGERGGRRDGFFVHVGFDGNVGPVRQFGSPHDDSVDGIAFTHGTVFVGGTTDGRLGGHRRGGTDGYVRAMTPGGSTIWSNMVGTPQDDAISAIGAAPDYLIVSGSTAGELPGQAARGGTDAFIVRLRVSGRITWLHQFGSPGDDLGSTIALDRRGVSMAGSATRALPGQTGLGESDAFATRFMRDGVQIWTIQFGTNDFDVAYAVANLGEGVFVAGTTHGAFDGETNAGDRDVFVTRLQLT